MGSRGTLPPVDSFGAGGGGGVAAPSLPGADHVLFVDTGPATGTEDGTLQDPFHAIADALTAAAALVPAADNPVVIYMFPGDYAEDGLNSVDYVRLVGASRRAVRIISDALLLTVDDIHTSFWNITFEATDDVRTVLVNAATGNRIEFHECGFVQILGSSGYVNIINNSDVLFKDCIFELKQGADISINMDGAVPNVLLDGCIIYGEVQHTDGNLVVRDCELYGGVSESGSPDNLLVEHSRVSNSSGHAIQIGNYNKTIIIRNNVLVGAVGSYDLYSTNGAVGQAFCENNIMTRGIHLNVGLDNEQVNVGSAGDYDFYESMYAALRFNSDTRNLVVVLNKDSVETTTSLVQNEKVTVHLNGHKVSIANRTTILRSYLAGSELVVEGPGELEGSIDVASSAALYLSDLFLDGQIEVQSGFSGILDVDCCVVSPAGAVSFDTALLVEGADGSIAIKHSFIKGPPGEDNCAVYYLTNTNNNIHSRHTTFVNGDGANAPFGRSGVQTPNITLHNCALNAALPAWLTNLIAVGQEFTTVDTNIDFP